jgi:hypothetical protein
MTLVQCDKLFLKVVKYAEIFGNSGAAGRKFNIQYQDADLS